MSTSLRHCATALPTMQTTQVATKGTQPADPPNHWLFDWSRDVEFPHWSVNAAETFSRKSCFTKLLGALNFIFCLDQVNGHLRDMNVALFQFSMIVMFTLAFYDIGYNPPDLPSPLDDLTDTGLLVFWFMVCTAMVIPVVTGQHIRGRSWLCAVGICFCGLIAMLLCLFHSDSLWQLSSPTDILITFVLALIAWTATLQLYSLLTSCLGLISARSIPSEILLEWYSTNYTADLLRPVPSQPVQLRAIESSPDQVLLEWYTPCAFTTKAKSFELLYREESIAKNNRFKSLIEDVKQRKSRWCSRGDIPEQACEYMYEWEEFKDELLDLPIAVPSIAAPRGPSHRVRCRVKGLQPDTVYSFQVRATTSAIDYYEAHASTEHLLHFDTQMFNGGGRSGRASESIAVCTQPIPDDSSTYHGGCCGLGSEFNVPAVPVEGPPPVPPKLFRGIDSMPSLSQWCHYMRVDKGYSVEETLSLLNAEITAAETRPQQLLEDTKDDRGMLDLCLDFISPTALTQNPFCRLKFRFWFRLLPPKIRSSLILGLLLLVILMVLSYEGADQLLGYVSERETRYTAALTRLASLERAANSTASVANGTILGSEVESLVSNVSARASNVNACHTVNTTVSSDVSSMVQDLSSFQNSSKLSTYQLVQNVTLITSRVDELKANLTTFSSNLPSSGAAVTILKSRIDEMISNLESFSIQTSNNARDQANLTLQVVTTATSLKSNLSSESSSVESALNVTNQCVEDTAGVALVQSDEVSIFGRFVGNLNLAGDSENSSGLDQSPKDVLEQEQTFWHDLYGPLEGLWAAAIIALTMLPCTVLAVRKKLMDLRIGKPSFYADHALYEGYYATGFYGAYMSFIALGFILLYFTFFLVIWTMAWAPTFEGFWAPFFKWLFWWGIAYVIDTIWLKTQLFQNLCLDGENKNWIRRPELYAIVDTVLACYYVPYQAMASIFRMLYVLLFTIISLFRPDVDLMPRGAETFDAGYERQRHPVLLCFFECLSKPSTPPRISKVARNRWGLALLLMKNPSLRKYRRSRISTVIPQPLTITSEMMPLVAHVVPA